jgi:hypothetical protein
MMKRLLLSFPTLALAAAFAAASSYHVTLFSASSVGGKTLNPGDYKVEVNGDDVVFKRAKETVQAPGKLETVEKKFNSTSVRYNDQKEIQEICIGGTNKKIVVNGPASGTAPKETLR